MLSGWVLIFLPPGKEDVSEKVPDAIGRLELIIRRADIADDDDSDDECGHVSDPSLVFANAKRKRSVQQIQNDGRGAKKQKTQSQEEQIGWHNAKPRQTHQTQ